MRLILSFLTLFTGFSVFAQGQYSAPLDKAKQNVERIRDLVKAGALPRARLDQAEETVADAQDEMILRQTLYGKLNVEDLTKEQAEQMIAAAERQVERQQARLDKFKALVDQGVVARSELTPYLEDLDTKKRAVDLAQSRARLMEELANMARVEAAHMEAPQTDSAGEHRVAERYEGNGAFNDADFKKVEFAFEKRFAKPLPVSAQGETATHRALGFDHRGRVDVALNPDQQEGIWLRKYLESRKLPYFAFRAALPGRATGPHIHMGPPSQRLVSAD